MDRQFFERYYQTYNSENPDALRAFYADDVVLTSSQGEQRGAEAIIGTYQYLIEHFEDRMTPETILVDGDTAAIEITDIFTARHDVDSFMGASLKQGEQLTLKLCAVYRVQNDKIVSATIYQR